MMKKERNSYSRADAMKWKVRNIHFVGIGGIGMSGIAEVLLNLGYNVSGSDIALSDITHRLETLGARIYKGHDRRNVGQTDVVVTSTAVRSDNPEVLEALRRGIPVIPRAEMLAELLKMKFSIAISGSHGKTTTTSMIATVLAAGGLDPTMVIGGKLMSIGSNARLGGGELIVAEADESDGSFLKLNPHIAVITNIDREHLDFYRGIEDIRESFLKFANSVPFYGCAVVCGDDPNVLCILPEVKRRIVTYGIKNGDYRARDIKFLGRSSLFTVCYQGSTLGQVEINVPGRFNVYNSLAAVAVGRELDMDFEDIREGLRQFSGVHRRLEVKGEVNGVTVVDDYGHHPTEIYETLAAARMMWDGRRLIVVFQPHRYTRTKALFDEFSKAFPEADVLIVTEIYAASEDPIPGVSGEALFSALKERNKGEVHYIANLDDVVDFLVEIVRPTDVVITQGAGSVWKVGESLLKRMA
ncbi:MAG: UDP-N-acetylmuramate--L-alanine ligase [Syntrophales bacterium]|nr:UDP-N-acetylmuramate--L-alanine ligase [Syntrophales bacterium]